MESFVIECTTCHARLKVRSRSGVGKIVECPKCGSFVEVTAPPDWQQSDDGIAEDTAEDTQPQIPQAEIFEPPSPFEYERQLAAAFQRSKVADSRPESGLGLASMVIGVCCAIYFLVTLLFATWVSAGLLSSYYWTGGTIAGVTFAIVGLGLAIVAFMQKDRSHRTAKWGIILNGAPIVLPIVLLVVLMLLAAINRFLPDQRESPPAATPEKTQPRTPVRSYLPPRRPPPRRLPPPEAIRKSPPEVASLPAPALWAPEADAIVPPAGPEPNRRLPVPDVVTREQNIRRVESRYRARIAAALRLGPDRGPVAVSNVAGEILAAARGESNAGNKLALFTLARQVAMDAGNCHLAFQAVDAESDVFEVDRTGGKVDALAKTFKVRVDDVNIATLHSFVDELLAGGDIDAAERSIAVLSATMPGGLTAREKAFADGVGRFKLDRSTANRGADGGQIAGEFYLLVLQDPEHAISFLTRGHGGILSPLAEADALAPDSDVGMRLLADMWDRCYEAHRGELQFPSPMVKLALLDRAAYWWKRLIDEFPGSPSQGRAREFLARWEGDREMTLKEISLPSGRTTPHAAAVAAEGIAGERTAIAKLLASIRARLVEIDSRSGLTSRQKSALFKDQVGDWNQKLSAMKIDFKVIDIQGAGGNFSFQPGAVVGVEPAEWLKLERSIRCPHMTAAQASRISPGDTLRVSGRIRVGVSPLGQGAIILLRFSPHGMRRNSAAQTEFSELDRGVMIYMDANGRIDRVAPKRAAK